MPRSKKAAKVVADVAYAVYSQKRGRVSVVYNSRACAEEAMEEIAMAFPSRRYTVARVTVTREEG